MRGIRCGLAVVGAVIILALAAPAQEAPAPAEAVDPEAGKARLAERNRLWRESHSLLEQGKPEQAITVAEEVLTIDRVLCGGKHWVVARTLGFLAELLELAGDFAAARDRLKDALGIRTELHGAGHWRLTDARLALEALDLRAGRDPEQRKLLVEAEALSARALDQFRAGEYRGAIEPAMRALEIRRRILGGIHESMGEYGG